MRVGAHHGSDASRKIMRERDLLARRFSMEINEDGNVLGHRPKRGVRGMEWTVDRPHEDASQQIQHREAADGRGHERPPLPGGFGRQVCRTHEILHAGNLGRKLLLPPHVVAQCDCIRPRLEDLLRERRRDAGPRGAVLRVHDDGGDPEFTPNPGKILLENPSARTPDHVANHQNLHLHQATKR